ncbi:MAG: hypothetical protein O3C40_23285 [Planctomycetota bacterium]|nr:hypothetical protein [Planctomycetota bacterium]
MRIHRGWLRVLLPFNLRTTKSPRPLDATLRAAFFREDSAWLGLDSGSDRTKVSHSDYYEEYLPHAHSFLFAAAGATGCRYLKLKRDRIPLLLAGNAEVWTRTRKPVKEKSRLHSAASSLSLRGLQTIGIAAGDPIWNASPPFDLPNSACRCAGIDPALRGAANEAPRIRKRRGASVVVRV